MDTQAPTLLREGETCWRIAGCERARVLVDAADYFLALRRALLEARQRVFIIGWDIDSRTPLVGPDGVPEDDLPAALGPFLTELVKRRPALKVHLLLWDYSMLYALEREPLPAVALDWATPAQISVCLDDVLPTGACHHQKIVVVDDSLAFSGGLDLTIRRWDTSEHKLANPLRKDPADQTYRPFHDIQMMVDGDAARALAVLARDRWQRAACEDTPAVEPDGDRWPQGFEADFHDTRVGIARTLPSNAGEPEAREVEALFLRSIAAAEHSIYIENQFLTTTRICDALIERLRERSDLEVLIIAPNVHQSWLEERSMNAGRRRFMESLKQAAVDDRVKLVYPALPGDETSEGVMVHAKLMIVDDRLLRVGSANLNNRSMGTDTECDLAIEAEGEREREIIARLRCRLLAEHIGSDVDAVQEFLTKDGSLFALVERFSENERALKPIVLDDVPTDEISRAVGPLADPERPLQTPSFIGDMFGGEQRAAAVPRILKLAAAGAALLALVALWRYTPLSELTDPRNLLDSLQALAGDRWMPAVILAAFVIGGLVVFPVTVLIAVTGMLYSPPAAFAYALAGSLLSAVLTYILGKWVGARPLRNLAGRRVNRILRALSRRGVISVAALRMLPIAPFTLINLAAGASRIRFLDYLAGTFLGMAPGILVIAVLGNQLGRVLSDPELDQLLILGGLVCVWLAVSLGLQALASRLRTNSND